jgi:hypothetical protein
MPRTSKTPTKGTSIESTPEIRAKALVVHERLCREYGCPIAYFHELDPLSELVSSLLSHRTKNSDSGRAFKQLRRRFPTWDAVRDAPTADVEDAIAPVTWPEQKAPRIQAILREISARQGTLDEHTLDFLAERPVREARDWLEVARRCRSEDERRGAPVQPPAPAGAAGRQSPSSRRAAARVDPGEPRGRAVARRARGPASAGLGCPAGIRQP